MGTAADATLPEGWRIDRQTSAPRTVGSYAASQNQTMYAGGASLPSNAKNGLWNFGQDDSSDRAVGGISTGVADGTRCVNVYAHFLNTGIKNIENLQISYDVEKYRKGKQCRRLHCSNVLLCRWSQLDISRQRLLYDVCCRCCH